MYGFVPIIHIVAAVFAIIELGLIGYIVTPFTGPWWGPPSVESFLLFNSIWSLLVLAYVGLTPLYYTRVFHRLVSLAVEWITMIFWFAGAIALAVFWGSPHCGGNTYCGTVEAAIAFAFFLWALFLVLVVVDTFEAMRSRGHSTTTHQTPYVGA
ncbi:marvel domain-containing protein [Podospora appendiculata]|uniref:Marvel domain-containing protein n=1 Tax=Podospora appendiculata TaxID=314037 RepID=A0AAE1CE64_9PEZI|nr:marvel domain-containing protein [Podospora appendiculata]